MTAEITVITVIDETAVTVDVVAPAERGRHERAARTARVAAVSVRRRRTMTNHAMVGIGCCSCEGGSSGCKQPEEGIIRIINLNEMMKMII